MLKASRFLAVSLLLMTSLACSTEQEYKRDPNKTYSSSTKKGADAKGKDKGGSDTSKDKEKDGAGKDDETASPPSGDEGDEGVDEGESGMGGMEPDPTKDPVKNPDDGVVVSPPVTDIKVRASGGSGGGSGLLEISWKDSTGLASSYKINAPEDASKKVYGLHIHLHGDGGGGYKDFPNKELRYGLIGVSVKAPNTGMTWGRAAGKAHAFYLNELIQNELVKKYNIDLDKIVFSTVSGGSYFITGNFIAEYGHIYKSKAFVMCGGEQPRVAFKDPSTIKNFRVHWEYTSGERADIVPSIEKSIAAFKKAALDAGVTQEELAKLHTVSKKLPGPHCEFDNKSYTSGIQKSIDDEFKAFIGG